MTNRLRAAILPRRLATMSDQRAEGDSMKAIILSAGQGKRLLPMTAESPKCLLPLGSKPLLGWQVEALAKAGIEEAVVVTGFHAEKVDAALAGMRRPGIQLRSFYNPFYAVADNLASCWLVRGEMTGEFVLLNGDTVFESRVIDRLLASPAAPVTVTIDRKPSYDADDMKVRVEGGRLREIGKTLPLDVVNGESIGMLLFRGEGPRLFSAAVEEAMRSDEAVRWWYLSVVSRLAKTVPVGTALVEGLDWGEVDYPPDLIRARVLAQRWERAERPAMAGLAAGS